MECALSIVAISEALAQPDGEWRKENDEDQHNDGPRKKGQNLPRDRQERQPVDATHDEKQRTNRGVQQADHEVDHNYRAQMNWVNSEISRKRKQRRKGDYQRWQR
jgi:hypothetical protein